MNGQPSSKTNQPNFQEKHTVDLICADVVFQKGDAENVNNSCEDLTDHHRNMESMNLGGGKR